MNKPAIEIGESNELLYLFNVPGCWPVEYILNLLLTHLYPLRSYVETCKFHFRDMEQALVNVDTEIILCQLL